MTRARTGWAPSRRQLRISAMPREARPYQGHRAGIVSRLVACAIDFLVVAGILAAAYGAWSLVLFLWRPSHFRFPDVSTDWVLLAGEALLFVYLAYAWRTTGRTWGDLLLGLRVVNRRGDPLGRVGSVARSALCVVFPIGILYVAVSRSNRSVADLVLRTSVIYDWGPTTVAAGPPVPSAGG
jgi:uncharacterized RDD family membrane protein YckC